MTNYRIKLKRANIFLPFTRCLLWFRRGSGLVSELGSSSRSCACSKPGNGSVVDGGYGSRDQYRWLFFWWRKWSKLWCNHDRGLVIVVKMVLISLIIGNLLSLVDVRMFRMVVTSILGLCTVDSSATSVERAFDLRSSSSASFLFKSTWKQATRIKAGILMEM